MWGQRGFGWGGRGNDVQRCVTVFNNMFSAAADAAEEVAARRAEVDARKKDVSNEVSLLLSLYLFLPRSLALSRSRV
jgi:hypothetical protein